MDKEKQLAEKYKKWKEGTTHSPPPKNLDEPLWRASKIRYNLTKDLFDQWEGKLGGSFVCTIMLMIPYMSYALWFTLLPPLKVIVPMAPSLVYGIFTGDYEFHSFFGMWVFFGPEDVGPPALFLPWGFFLFMAYFYAVFSMFTPEPKPKWILLFGLSWVYAFVSAIFAEQIA